MLIFELVDVRVLMLLTWLVVVVVVVVIMVMVWLCCFDAAGMFRLLMVVS